MPEPFLPPVVVIAGPTASGKSALALAVARITGGGIVNADSAQVYRDLRILSARPSPADEAAADHRLYGTRDGARACSAADWAADACEEIAALHAQRRLPILVGGTGMYLRTLTGGIAPVPPIDEAVRARIRASPVADNYAALLREDPDAANRLGPADSQRVARALEVIRSTGRSIVAWQASRTGGIAQSVRVAARVVLPPRDPLYARIDARFADMIDGGAAEVETLLARRLDPALPVMNAIGVREIAAFLTGAISRDAAIAAGRTATRQYAKRQVTWFRNQSPPAWQRIETPDEDQAAALAAAAAWD